MYSSQIPDYVNRRSTARRGMLKFSRNDALQCLRILVPPKGRGGMYSGRLKYTKKQNFSRN